MKYLISCSCEHTMEAHAEDGCLQRGCVCMKSQLEALDAAIDLASINPWKRIETFEQEHDQAV